ncbi:Rv1355c family protein [Nocardia aurantiaca]|uniref:Rv1355c family protein n=1 Tax=Nocardia aurantiaca TaxID=2675850 RepID=A0A6I3L2H4_9NOCA|nr:Rv1355c family protein [Nocardia aurantiaca]MTE15498.1 Rv1355c family protein [Nocardia aurantiaca]
MVADIPSDGEFRPLLLDESNPEDAMLLAALRADSNVEFSDLRDLLRAEFANLVAPPDLTEGPEADRWVYYPWRHRVLGLPGPQLLRIVRLDRNRNNLTYAEQEQLGGLSIGVVGQSVGHAVAYTLALEGICGRLRLADFDAIELVNLNRIPGTLFDIGGNKAVVTARRIAELDPYLPVEVFHAGVTDENLDEFLADLSIVVEECDSFDIKLAVREGARRHRLPLLMQTSDRGLLDVERFDLEPDRPPFHGLIGDIGTAELRGLTPREKAPYLIRILDGRNLSGRAAASMVELGESLNSWPQLGSEVLHGGASVATAVRRIGLNAKLPSGRTRLDLERSLDELTEPDPVDDLTWAQPLVEEPAPESGIAAVLFCAQRAPSVGNAQPWTLGVGGETVTISLAPERSSIVDIAYRGSAMAVGAALYNAKAAAAAQGMLGASELRVDGPGRLEAVLRLDGDTDPALARDYPALLARHTNRNFGNGAQVPPAVLAALSEAATAAGAVLRSVTDRADIDALALLLGESDRVRYLTPRMHREMLAELRWPGDDARTGMDLRSLDLAPDELAKLEIGRRADVMALVRAWAGGFALGESTRERVRTSSAVVAVTFDAPPPDDAAELVAYARAGEAVQRVWIEAERYGLAVQPVSPAFLYARRPDEVDRVSPEFADTLASVQGRFLGLLGVPRNETMAVVLRLSYAAATIVRSRRLPIPGADPAVSVIGD